jgi:hypothetical protein
VPNIIQNLNIFLFLDKGVSFARKKADPINPLYTPKLVIPPLKPQAPYIPRWLLGSFQTIRVQDVSGEDIGAISMTFTADIRTLTLSGSPTPFYTIDM